MELLKHLIPLLLTGSLMLLVVGIGMGSARGELLYVLTRPRLLIRALVAIDVVPLAAAIAIVTLFPGIPLPARAAILLMSISPVPPLMPGKASKLGGHQRYIYGLQAATALLAVITVPLLGLLADRWFEADARFPITVIAQNIATGVMIPLAVGLLLGRWLAPEFSARIAPAVMKFATLLVLLAFVPIIIGAWPQITTLVRDGTVVAMLAMAAITLLGGHLLGEKDLGDRSALAISSAMRHPGIALALVGANGGSKGITAGVLLYLVVGLIAMIPYQLLIGRAQKRAAADPASATA
jgi:BASS family bile acid:Na+ symporter